MQAWTDTHRQGLDRTVVGPGNTLVVAGTGVGTVQVGPWVGTGGMRGWLPH